MTTEQHHHFSVAPVASTDVLARRARPLAARRWQRSRALARRPRAPPASPEARLTAALPRRSQTPVEVSVIVSEIPRAVTAAIERRPR